MDKKIKETNDCTFTKTDFLFLVKCLNDDYVELTRKAWELEMRYLHLKEEAKKRWYYEHRECPLVARAELWEMLPF